MDFSSSFSNIVLDRRQQLLYEELQKKHLILEGQHVLLKNRYFGKAKNKGSVAARDKSKKKNKDKNKPTRKLPSERYPDAPLIERHVELA